MPTEYFGLHVAKRPQSPCIQNLSYIMRMQKLQSATKKKKNVWVYTEVYIHKHKNVGFQKNTNALL